MRENMLKCVRQTATHINILLDSSKYAKHALTYVKMLQHVSKSLNMRENSIKSVNILSTYEKYRQNILKCVENIKNTRTKKALII